VPRNRGFGARGRNVVARTASRLYQRVLGHPLVYDRVRPWVIGGLDMSPVYGALEAHDEDVIVDIGSGTGDALDHLTRFRAYHGFDIDEGAVTYARRRAGNRSGVTYHARRLTGEDLASIRPTLIILAGLLHHMSDDDAIALLGLAAGLPSLRRLVTQDVVYLPGEPVSNLLARFDRGRFVRHQPQYQALVARAGLRPLEVRLMRSHPDTGRAIYLVMTLARVLSADHGRSRI
jgi:SAM-dependent methyltransferase